MLGVGGRGAGAVRLAGVGRCSMWAVALGTLRAALTLVLLPWL